jgi:hypothetical protein
MRVTRVVTFDALRHTRLRDTQTIRDLLMGFTSSVTFNETACPCVGFGLDFVYGTLLGRRILLPLLVERAGLFRCHLRITPLMMFSP